MLLQVSPDVFGRVQFGSVGRQIEGFNLSVQAGEVILNEAAAVSWQTIPDEQDRLVDLLREVLHKITNLLLSHASRVQSKIELPQGDASSHRQIVPVELVLQDGGHTALRPGANTVRPLAEAVGAVLGGTVTMTLKNNGDYTAQFHMHDSGATGYSFR
jgi:hypothetical protein